jgi:hypothetical protein
MLIANVYGMLHAYILPDKDELGWCISDIDLVDNLEDLDGKKIKSYLPKDAKSIEIQYKDSEKIVIVDYLKRIEVIKEV